MTPLERVLARFPSARAVKGGYEARCPAHDDRRASLFISTGDDGRALLFCHARCPTRAVLKAIGLTFPDLFPANSERPSRPWVKTPSPPSSRPEPPQKPKRVYATPEKAALAYGLGHPDRTWVYQAADAVEIGRVLRWNYPNGLKAIRPLATVSHGWVLGSPCRPRGLYGLPEILRLSAETVWLCEGEKCADWVASLGLLGTSTWGGANGIQHADLTPLLGRRVVIVPDHDEAGIAYARDCIRLLSGCASQLEIVPPRCFAWKQDIADLDPETALQALGSATQELTLI
jgi:putative DNA primase/helicase